MSTAVMAVTAVSPGGKVSIGTPTSPTGAGLPAAAVSPVAFQDECAPDEAGAVDDEWTVMSGRTWKATLHLLADLPIAVALFAAVTVLLTLSVALAPLAGAGLALLVLTVNGAVLVGRFEHARAGFLLAVPAPRDPAACPQSVRQLLGVATSGRAWKSCLYALVMLPIGIVNAVVALVGWTLAAAALTSQLWAWLLPDPGIRLGAAHLRSDNPLLAVTITVGGAALAFLMPHIVRALSTVDRLLVRRLLG